MFDNDIQDVSLRKAYYGEHFKSLDNLGGEDPIHIVYDDTSPSDSLDDVDLGKEIWVSCCGLTKAVQWPVVGPKPSCPAVDGALTREWKSVDCLQGIYMEPRKLVDLPQSSDSSSVDSLDFDQVLYDVPSKIPSPRIDNLSKSDLFLHKSNPNLLEHRNAEVMYMPMGSDFNSLPYSPALPGSNNGFIRSTTGGSNSPMFHSASSENLSHRHVRFPPSSGINLGRRRFNRFNSTDVISLGSSLSEVEEISTSEENIYMELAESENNNRKEAKSKNHNKTKRALFSSKTSKGLLSPTEATKRFPYHVDSTGIKKKLTTLLKPKTPLYAKIKNCPPIERAVVDRTNVPLPALPVTKARLSQVEDPYSFIEEKNTRSLSSPISETPSLVPVEIPGFSSKSHAVMCEEGTYECPKCWVDAPQPNLDTHPAREKGFRKSLTLDLDRTSQGYLKHFGSQEDVSMLSPVLCCVKSPSEKPSLNIDHMYKEKCDNFDYDVPRALCTLSSPKEEFHAAALSRFKPKEVDVRPKKEKLHELDHLLDAIHSYLRTHATSNNLEVFNSELPSLLTESNPGYVDPVKYYKTQNIPLTLVGNSVQSNDSKPLYTTVLKKKDRLKNGQNKSTNPLKTEQNSSLSTDTDDDYTTIEDNHLSAMAKRKYSISLIYYFCL